METNLRATGRKAATAVEPLLVRPAAAWKILDCGNTHGYALIRAGELETFLDGKARKITVASIRAYIGRKLAAAGATGLERRAVPPRSRGRPRKQWPIGAAV